MTMRLAQILLLAFLLSAFTIGASATQNFNPGNYEIMNWIELPDGGSTKIERHIEFLPKEFVSVVYKIEGCKLLSKKTTGNTLSFESKCDPKIYSGMDRISGSFTFMGDTYEGTFIYKSAQGEMKVGIRGKRIGDTPESKPLPTSEDKLNEIDTTLRGIWSKMISYISNGDFEKALKLFHPLVREQRATIFEALKDKWPTIVKDQIEFKRNNINDESGYAQYELVTKESGRIYSYEVEFQKDQNDNWWLLDF